MTIYQDVELSMTGHLVPPVVHVKQYDHKARKVRCQLYTNSLEYTPPSNIILVYSTTVVRNSDKSGSPVFYLNINNRSTCIY